MTEPQAPDQLAGSPVWLHYHVPKTGGQTLRAVFNEHLGLGLRYAHLTRASDLSYPRINDDLAAMSPLERRQIVVAGGHAVNQETRHIFGEREIRELVVVRDAAERIESLYNYRVRQYRERDEPIADFEAWHAETPRNSMTRFLSHRLDVPHQVNALVERLATCDLVGATEHMDDWLPYLLRQLGLPETLPTRENVSGVHHERVFTLDDRLRDMVMTKHDKDVRFMERLAPLLDDHLTKACGDSVATPAARPVRVVDTAPSDTGRSATGESSTRPSEDEPSLLRTITTSRSRRLLQGGALVVWAAASVLAITTRSPWAIAVSAAITGAVALVALKIALVGAVSVDAAAERWQRSFERERAARPSTASELDVAETAFAQRQLMFTVRDGVVDELTAANDRIRLLERMVEPLIAANQAQYQELLAMREQLARATEDAGPADGTASDGT